VSSARRALRSKLAGTQEAQLFHNQYSCVRTSTQSCGQKKMLWGRSPVDSSQPVSLSVAAPSLACAILWLPPALLLLMEQARAWLYTRHDQLQWRSAAVATAASSLLLCATAAQLASR
jgi:hypothetical protein